MQRVWNLCEVASWNGLNRVLYVYIYIYIYIENIKTWHFQLLSRSVCCNETMPRPLNRACKVAGMEHQLVDVNVYIVVTVVIPHQRFIRFQWFISLLLRLHTHKITRHCIAWHWQHYDALHVNLQLCTYKLMIIRDMSMYTYIDI